MWTQTQFIKEQVVCTQNLEVSVSNNFVVKLRKLSQLAVSYVPQTLFLAEHRHNTAGVHFLTNCSLHVNTPQADSCSFRYSRTL